MQRSRQEKGAIEYVCRFPSKFGLPSELICMLSPSPKCDFFVLFNVELLHPVHDPCLLPPFHCILNTGILSFHHR